MQTENASPAYSIYSRYREADSAEWTDGATTTRFGSGTFEVQISSANMEPSTVYTFEVSLGANFPDSGRTASGSFTTPAPPSPVVTALSVGSVTRAGAEVTLTSGNAAAGSIVYLQHRASASAWDSSNLRSLTVESDGTAAHTLSGLSAGTAYEVRASFDDGFPDSQTRTGLFGIAASMDGVSAKATGQTTATAEVTLTGAAATTVHLRHGAGDAPSQWTATHTITSAASASFNLTGLAGNTAYRVEASLDGRFPAGTTVHDTFTTHPVRPSPPQNAQVTAEEDRSLVVEWTAPPEDGGSPVTGYRVQWKTGDGDFNAGDNAGRRGRAARRHRPDQRHHVHGAGDSGQRRRQQRPVQRGNRHSQASAAGHHRRNGRPQFPNRDLDGARGQRRVPDFRLPGTVAIQR